MDNHCDSCVYGIMVATNPKYGMIFTPETCDMFESDGCPDLFEVEINGSRIIAYREILGDQLKPGDFYIAKRNTGWQLGKCYKVNLDDGWVMSDPPCKLYSYNCNECHKVLQILSCDLEGGNNGTN